MKLILILFLQSILTGIVFAETIRLDLSEKQAKQMSEYFLSLGKDQKTKLPVKLVTDQVKFYSFLSGIHRITPKENESMLAIFANIAVGEKRVNKIIYKFTVTPEISFAESKKKDLDWSSILSKRKITQYLIEETEEKGHSIYKKTLLKINKK